MLARKAFCLPAWLLACLVSFLLAWLVYRFDIVCNRLERLKMVLLAYAGFYAVLPDHTGAGFYFLAPDYWKSFWPGSWLCPIRQGLNSPVF